MRCGLGSSRCCRRCRGGWVGLRLLVEAVILAVSHGFAVAGPANRVRAWRSAWKRHARFAADGVWDQVLMVLLTEADAAGSWTGRCRWTPRSPAPTSTRRTPPGRWYRTTIVARRTGRPTVGPPHTVVSRLDQQIRVIRVSQDRGGHGQDHPQAGGLPSALAASLQPVCVVVVVAGAVLGLVVEFAHGRCEDLLW